MSFVLFALLWLAPPRTGARQAPLNSAAALQVNFEGKLKGVSKKELNLVNPEGQILTFLLNRKTVFLGKDQQLVKPQSLAAGTSLVIEGERIYPSGELVAHTVRVAP